MRFSPALILAALVSLSLPGATRAGGADFSLPDLDGRQHRLADYRGKWVLVNYWATWCPPCLEELPELELFYSNHKDTDAVVLGVNMEDISVERLKRFVDEQFISYPILRSRPGAQTELGAVPGLPTSYLVSPRGEVVARQVGPVTARILDKFLESHGERGAGGVSGR